MQPSKIESLVQNPSESLNLEIKTWIDLSSKEGIAKLVKSIFAIRNRNGGHLLIGLNDKTLEPDPPSNSSAVKSVYSVDRIQALVSKYAQVPFDIGVQYCKRDRITIPVFSIPSGIREPVVVSRNLQAVGGKPLLKSGDIYFRTLRANGTPSSVRILPRDYAELIDICFENRESDIGRFLRRQISKSDLRSLAQILNRENPDSELKGEQRAYQVVEEGNKSMQFAISQQERQQEWNRVQDGLTLQAGLAIYPPRAESPPTEEFLNRVSASNPNYTGWPMWLDSSYFAEERHRAYVQVDKWEALLLDLHSNPFKHFDFYQFNPNGEFYLFRVMEDDLQDNVEARTVLDPTLTIRRVAEVLAVGVSLAKNLDWESDAIAHFAFKWTGLSQRTLVPWVRPMEWLLTFHGLSRSNEAHSSVQVRIGTPHRALEPYVSKAVGPLFSQFDGYEAPREVVEHCLNSLVTRS